MTESQKDDSTAPISIEDCKAQTNTKKRLAESPTWDNKAVAKCRDNLYFGYRLDSGADVTLHRTRHYHFFDLLGFYYFINFYYSPQNSDGHYFENT